MKIFFPKSLLNGLSTQCSIKYMEFFATHALLKSEYCIAPEGISSSTFLSYSLLVDTLSWNIYEDTNSVVLSTSTTTSCEYECHVSDSLWGTWWHNGNYPTLPLADNSVPKILLLPITFGFGSSSIDLITSRVKATENAPLISATNNLPIASITNFSSFTSNQISSYSFDIASKISYSGFRFSNRQYSLHRKRNKSDSFIVAIIGGSAAFCDCSPDTLSFPSLLEDFLNLGDSGMSYIVYNFGQIGATLSSLIPTVANEIIPLRPDLIISYTGYNEVRNSIGQPSNFDLSPHALPHAHSSYVNKEFYAQEASHNYLLRHMQSVNANDILNAIINNHKIHKAMAEVCGSQYLAVLQPISYVSVPKMTAFERAIYQHYSSSFDLKTSYQKVHHLLSELPMHLTNAGFDTLNMQDIPILQTSRADFHSIKSLFHDTMHQTFNLEPYLALALSQHILKHTFSKRTQTKIAELYQFPFFSFF